MTRDLRRYARQTNVRLIAGGLLLTLLIGEGLIYIFYGATPALMGLVCMLLGMAPLVLIWGGLWLLDWIVQRANPR